MRTLTLTGPDGTIRADLDRPFDLSIPLLFDGEQPNAFGAPAATAEAFRSGGFIGDVSLGGSCNCKQYHIVPHSNGTHTECVGHITHQRIDVHEVLRGGMEPALLLSIPIVSAEDCSEDTDPKPRSGDKLITAQAIDVAWRQQPWAGTTVRALALRTLPNDVDKQTRRYSADAPPPYLTRQAAELLVARGIEHLLLDVPSFDRLDDGGKLTGHRIFWGLPPGANDVKQAQRPRATITELMFAADRIRDGRYLLDLQLAPFAADAAPSRPLLYPVIDPTAA